MSFYAFYPPTSTSILPVGASTSANQVLEIAQLTAINSNTTGSATATNQSTEIGLLTAMNNRMAGSLVPLAYDETDLSYIISGPGAGQVGTVLYKLASILVATLTLTYDGSNNLLTAVKT